MRRTWSLRGLLACVASVSVLGPAAAADTMAEAVYQLSFAGIPFGSTRYDGIFSANSYDVRSHFKTSGIVSVFWQAEIDAHATGRHDAHRLTPGLYESFYRRGEERKQRVAITFNDGAPVTEADPPYDTTSYPVTVAQQREALDPMSALTLIVLGLHATPKQPCGTVAPVFDGRRRYNISLSHIKDEPYVMPNNLFRGTAHLCRIRYEQIAGYKPKIMKEGQSWPAIFGYFADIPHAAAPNGRYVIALKLWAQTKWGVVDVRLVERKLEETAAAAP